MRKILYIICAFILCNIQCNKNCHKFITIINNSNQDIIRCSSISSENGGCRLDGPIMKPGDRYEHTAHNRGIKRSCWEKSLGGGYELYIVDPIKFNAPNVFYNCDSIETKNKVLKHYVLTLSELKGMNFTISYP